MRIDTKTTPRLLLAVLTVVLLGPGTEALAQTQGDRIVVYSQDQLLDASLPRGPLAADGSIEEAPLAMAFGPDDHLYVIRHQQTEPPFLAPRISRVEDDGQLTDLGEIPLFGGEDPLDFAFGPDGNLHILTFGITVIAPPDIYQRLLTLDPQTLETLDSRFLPPPFDTSILAVAPADDGLWLLNPEKLSRIDLADGHIETLDIDLLGLGVPVAADTDTTGALWILTEPGFIDPPIFFLKRLDPVTGSLTDASFRPESSAGPMAIQRRCSDTPTTRCLQGGRFLATVIWTDFAQVSGHGQVVPNSSADSTLFWFFDPANWELLVKVLDGCDDNGHFWVFAGATTDVGFELIVEDLETGDAFVFNNPLGNPPQTVNATSAFPGCP